jgi:ketosteroid isomerase-like protein
MRHFLAITMTAVGLAAGCSSESVGPPPAPPVNWHSLDPKPKVDAARPGPTESERRLADVYATALGGGAANGPDPLTGPALGAHLDEDARFEFPGWQDVHGRDAVVRAHALLFGAFDRRIFTLTRVWRTPSQQALEWTLTAVQARDWNGVAATGRPVRVAGLTVLSTTDEGLIAEVHVYMDAAAVRAQLGAGPKELQALPMAQVAPAPLGSASSGMAEGMADASPPDAASKVFEQSGSADEMSAVMLVRASLDALEGNHEAAYADTMSDDVEIHTSERAQPWRGKADARAYFKAIRKAIGQLDTTVMNAQGVATFAIVEYTIAGEQLGPLFWMPAQRDKAIRLHVADVVEVGAGKIRRIWRYGNPEEVLKPSPE